jgi:hypothetical protein
LRHRSLLLPLLGLCLIMGGLSPAWARLIRIKGDTTVRRAGDGYTVHTGPNDRAALLFEDGSLVKLNGNTTLELPAAPRTSRLALASLRLVAPMAADVPAGGPSADTLLEGPIPPRLLLRQGEIWLSTVQGRRVTTEARAGSTPVAAARTTPDGAELDLRLAEDGTTTLTVGEGEVEFANAQDRVVVRRSEQSVARPGQPPTRPVAVNLPVLIEWTNDLQPVALPLETIYVSQDPERLKAALREAEALPAGAERSRRLGDVRHDRGELQQALAAYEAALAALGPDAPAGGVPAKRVAAAPTGRQAPWATASSSTCAGTRCSPPGLSPRPASWAAARACFRACQGGTAWPSRSGPVSPARPSPATVSYLSPMPWRIGPSAPWRPMRPPGRRSGRSRTRSRSPRSWPASVTNTGCGMTT